MENYELVCISFEFLISLVCFLYAIKKSPHENGQKRLLVGKFVLTNTFVAPVTLSEAGEILF